MLALFNGPIASWGIADILIAIVLIAAGVGIVIVALRVFKVTIPEWVVQIFWICVVAFVAVMAIRWIFSL